MLSFILRKCVRARRRNRSTIRLYIDGLLAQTVNTGLDQNSLCFGADIQIGRDWSTYPNPFIEKIDDVAIYSRALTGEEILKIFNNNGF